jgi:hypothetical protein
MQKSCKLLCFVVVKIENKEIQKTIKRKKPLEIKRFKQ